MGKTIIVTAGPTNEKIDEVMQITNMSTGRLGALTAIKLLSQSDIDKVYYLSPKLAEKPKYSSDDRNVLIQIGSTDDLLKKLTELLTNPNEHIDAVVHSAAVGDYKGRYAARAEDVALEIKEEIEKYNGCVPYATILRILKNPKCTKDSKTKISSYEPNLMVMLDLTPKVISHIKELSPDTMLIGFKLLKDVTQGHLLDVSMESCVKNKADVIIGNDLSRIGNGKHWAMAVTKDGIKKTMETKDEIAEFIVDTILNGGIRQ